MSINKDIRRGIIVSLDLTTQEDIKHIIDHTIEHVIGYKIGTQTVMLDGLKWLWLYFKDHHHKYNPRLIADFQKFGSDIPEQPKNIIPILKECGMNDVIVFPHAGPVTLESWISVIQKYGLNPIVGAEMTHPKFLQKDGGYITNTAPYKIFSKACKMGVKDFVLPGNKLFNISEYRTWIEDDCDVANPTYWSPGLVTQGGNISEAGKAMGDKSFYAIVGRGIYNSENPTKSVKLYNNTIKENI